ncbi:hypothetical protein BSKO_02392 [Bryopsis sp. KO-2023]|nr:hypothetical protein BSKO_02392 [Bryopsis sp. KO-2023]
MNISQVLADRGLLADLASEYGDVRLTRDPAEREAWLQHRLKEHSIKCQSLTQSAKNEPSSEAAKFREKSYNPKMYQSETQTENDNRESQVNHTQRERNLTGFVPKFFARPKQPPTFCLHGDAKVVKKEPEMGMDYRKLEASDREKYSGSKPEAYFDTHSAEKQLRDAWGRPLSKSPKPDWVHAVDLHTALQSNAGIPSRHANFQNQRKFAQVAAHAKQKVKLMGTKDQGCFQNMRDGCGVDCMTDGGVDPRIEARLTEIQETMEEQSMRLKEQGDVFQALLDSMAESRKTSVKETEVENSEMLSKDVTYGHNLEVPDIQSPQIVIKMRADSMGKEIPSSSATAKGAGSEIPKKEKSREPQSCNSKLVEDMSCDDPDHFEVLKSCKGMDATNELLLLAKMADAGGVLGNVLVGSTLRRAVKDWIRSLRKGSKAATGIDGLTEVFKILNMQGEFNGQRQTGDDGSRNHAPMYRSPMKENVKVKSRQEKYQAVGKRKEKSSWDRPQMHESKGGTEWNDSTHVDPSLWESFTKNRSGRPGPSSKSHKECAPDPALRQAQKQHQHYTSKPNYPIPSKPLHPNDNTQTFPQMKTLFEQFQELGCGGSMERAEMESEVLVEPLKVWLANLEGKMEDWMMGVEQRIGEFDQNETEAGKGASIGKDVCMAGGVNGKGAELKELLSSLEEMESEEERVRRRWLNGNGSDRKTGSKSCKDDQSTQEQCPVSISGPRCSAPRSNAEVNYIWGEPCGKRSQVEILKEEQKHHRAVRSAILRDRVNEESLPRILKCRKEHFRQQKLSDAVLGTGKDDQEVPCPVKIIENIADNFVEDMLKEQLLELEQACDEICEGLFDSEFLPAK